MTAAVHPADFGSHPALAYLADLEMVVAVIAADWAYPVKMALSTLDYLDLIGQAFSGTLVRDLSSVLKSSGYSDLFYFPVLGLAAFADRSDSAVPAAADCPFDLGFYSDSAAFDSADLGLGLVDFRSFAFGQDL